MAVCDIVVAAEDAMFSLSEARLGLIPAVIAPFLLRKAGESFLRRYALTGETFTTSVSTKPDEIVFATAVPQNAPIKFIPAASITA